MTGALLESTAAYGNRYGTGRDALATQLARADVLLALDRHGALALRAALSELVRTTIPSRTGVLQLICSLGALSTSTRHIRQTPAMERSG